MRRVFFTNCQPPVKKREIGKHAHGYKDAVKLRSPLLKVLMGYVPPYDIYRLQVKGLNYKSFDTSTCYVGITPTYQLRLQF